MLRYFRFKRTFAFDLPNNKMNKDNFQPIFDALTANNLPEAESLIAAAETAHGPHATLYYLQGKVYMKQSDWRNALNCFLKAEELEPEGPARECRLMLNDIMNFYNKDMFNQ